MRRKEKHLNPPQGPSLKQEPHTPLGTPPPSSESSDQPQTKLDQLGETHIDDNEKTMKVILEALEARTNKLSLSIVFGILPLPLDIYPCYLFPG